MSGLAAGEPGEKYTYSNTNYTLLGMIIEEVAGHSLARELDRRLFRPLGMTRTSSWRRLDHEGRQRLLPGQAAADAVLCPGSSTEDSPT